MVVFDLLIIHNSKINPKIPRIKNPELISIQKNTVIRKKERISLLI